MEIQLLRDRHHQRCLNARSIERYIQSPSFTILYKNCTGEEQEKINYYVDTLNKTALEKLISKKTLDGCSIEELPVMSLRQKAKELGVLNWQYLPKASLLSEIMKLC